MSLLAAIVLANEGTPVVNELPFPAWVFGVAVLVLFIIMGLVTYSFRDVANRHAKKAEAYAREHGVDHE